MYMKEIDFFRFYVKKNTSDYSTGKRQNKCRIDNPIDISKTFQRLYCA